MDTIWQPELIQGAGPKYKAVMQAIRDRIEDGALSPGDKLPPVRDLAWRLGITPGTVARAYTMLTDDGTLLAEVGRGTFVARQGDRRPLLAEVPIEVDSVRHGSGAEGQAVNLFSPHLPSVGQAELIRTLLAGIAAAPPSGVMHYPSRAGTLPARTAVARYLSSGPSGPVTGEDVILANGAQNAILLILQTVLTGRRPTVLVEELSYPGFRRAAELLRADVVPVRMDGDGICPDALAAAARAHDAQILCTSPEVHNPTLGFTPTARRKELVEVARQHDIQILEDDCYRLGTARAPGYRMLAPERTWYVTSISKSITPALRIGMAVAPAERSAALRRNAEYAFFGLATPLTDLCAALFEHPDLPALLGAARDGIGAYVRCAVNVLGAYDLHWREDVPFLWLPLPNGWRAGAFVQAAERAGVRIRAAEEYAGRDARAPHAVRFAVNAGVSPGRFEDAVIRLRDLLDNPADGIGV